MPKIIGNTTATPNPRPDWAQTDSTKADYIKNKPTNVSDFTNDAGYLTEHQSLDGLATENYVDTKIATIPTPDVSGQINTHNTSDTAHSDIRTAIGELESAVDGIDVPTALSELTDDATHRLVTDTEKSTWNSKANTSDIPDALSDLNEDETHRTVTDAEKIAWNAKSDFNGDYNYLTNKPNIPTVPTNVSAFTNDAGYLTSVPTDYAKKTDVPTKTSQLTNDSNFLTSVPSEYVTETALNAKGYLTSHQDISGKVDKTTTVNDKTLDKNITLSAEDVGAVPTTRTINGQALSADVTITAAELNCAPAYTYGTTDLEAGVSPLEHGKLYFVYE